MIESEAEKSLISEHGFSQENVPLHVDECGHPLPVSNGWTVFSQDKESPYYHVELKLRNRSYHREKREMVHERVNHCMKVNAAGDLRRLSNQLPTIYVANGQSFTER